MRIIIGLVGLKQCGKSTAFRFIKELAPEGVAVHEVKFAGLLKEACAKAAKLDIDYFEDVTLKEAELKLPIKFDTEARNTILRIFGLEPTEDRILMSFHTPRKMLQIVGTEVLRTIDPNIHVRKTLETMPKEGIIVVTDLRFINEFNSLADEDGFHPYYIENHKVESRATSNHASETQPKKLRSRCKILKNVAGLPEFREEVNNMLTEVLRSKNA